MPEHDDITSSQDYRYQKFEIEITDFIGAESTHGQRLGLVMLHVFTIQNISLERKTQLSHYSLV